MEINSYIEVYKCPGKRCGKAFGQILSFTSHFPVAHINVRLSCTMCPNYFVNEIDYNQHIKIHKPTSPVKPKKIFECAICLTPVNDVKQHVMVHVLDYENRIYVYICKYCRSFYRSKQTYATHLQRCSKLLLNNQVKLELQQIGARDDDNAMCGVIKECKTCNAQFQFQCKFRNVKHLVVNCSKCGGTLSKETVIKLKTLKERKLNENEPIGNVLVCWNQDRGQYSCILCEKVLQTKNSICVCKYKNPIVRLERSTGSMTLNDVSKPKRLKLIDSTSTPSSSSMLLNDEYKCKICNSGFGSRDAFREHVQEHRDVSTAYQCMECGECFVVKPSLRKHLQMFHFIRDVDAYLEENECFDKEAMRSLEEHMRMVPGEVKGPVAENQCRICREIFPDGLELSKHFRVHGMAFLMNKIIK